MKKLLLAFAVLCLAACAPTAAPVVVFEPSAGYTVDALSAITVQEPLPGTTYNELKLRVGGTSSISTADLYLFGPDVRVGVNGKCTTLSTSVLRCKVPGFKAPYNYALPYRGKLLKAFAEYTNLDTGQNLYTPIFGN